MAIRKIYLLGAALVALGGFAAFQKPEPAAAEVPAKARPAPKAAMQTPPIQVYRLAGQSNMVGYGLMEDLTPAEKTAQANIKVYGNDWVQRNALDPLDINTNQVDQVSNETGPMRVGPGLFFARSMVASGAAPGVVLIPCAKGGSPISAWAPSTSRSTLFGTLFGSCLARAKMYNGNYPIAGILWYQGEADARQKITTDTWPANFRAMVLAFRQQLNRPNLPVVYVGLGDANPAAAGTYPYWAQMQYNQANTGYPCTAHVSAKGLAQNSDLLHIATAGQRALGPKLATAMRTLRQSCF